MRASRLVSVLLLLQARGRMTAADLAATLEVSVRTIYRDMDALSAAGVPVCGDAGPDGGYQLIGGYRTRLTGLTEAEAQALPLAALPAAAAELGLGPTLATAQLKLAAALPGPLRDRAATIGERFHLDAPGWYAEAESPPLLAAVAGAVWDSRPVTIRYRRWAEPAEVTRTVEPHGIVLKNGNWYLVARRAAAPGEPGQMRTYRVSQILDVTVGEQVFLRQPDFSLTAWWRASVAEFRAGLARGEATVRLTVSGAGRLRGAMGPDVSAALDDAGEPGPGGWLTAVVPVESPAHAEAEFLKLGTDLEVLAPPELRHRMATVTAALAARYASEPPPPADPDK
jgi:predicted DNA-binding transcriptional regulator YafY